MSRKVTNCSGEDLDTAALKADPYREVMSPMKKVMDTGPLLSSPHELSEARTYFQQKGRTPMVWAPYLTMGDCPPYLFEKTSFVNYFGEEVVVLIDMYRPPWKRYYTSDVFFSQWLSTLGKDESVQYLPDTFPTTLYINNITNPDTKRELKKMLKGEEVCIMEPDEIENWSKLRNTPHLKCVQNILTDFDQIKGRHGEGHTIDTIQCYKEDEVYNLKMQIKK